MNTDAFNKWLTENQGMTVRSSRDVISRCKRVNKITGQDEITELTIEIINNNEEFLEKSMFVKSQLRRAVALYLAFKQYEQRGDS